jgi:hypothetical protein
MELLRTLPPSAWVLLGSFALAGWGSVQGIRFWRRRRLRKAVVASITAPAFDHLVDVLVPDGMGGSFHVDFLLLTARGIVAIDLRDVRGNVFGGDQMSEWTVMDTPRRATLPNPQYGLYDRVAAVKAVVGEVPVEGRVLFTRRARFPKGLPRWTATLETFTVDFPPSERESFSDAVVRYAQGWERIRAAVAPSRLSQVTPAEAP